MRKIIVTGLNGVGKSHFAARLAHVRPDIPVVSFDALKLMTNWRQKPRPEIDAALIREVEKPEWILEGGPSALFQAAPHADALVWLDPPEPVRLLQLARRPWISRGKTRTEIPDGNVDWPWQQYGFAWRSFRKRAQNHAYLSGFFAQVEDIPKWQCRSEASRAEVLRQWSNG